MTDQKNPPHTPSLQTGTGAEFADWPRGSTGIFLVEYIIGQDAEGEVFQTGVFHAPDAEKAIAAARAQLGEVTIYSVERSNASGPTAAQQASPYPAARFLNGEFRAVASQDPEFTPLGADKPRM